MKVSYDMMTRNTYLVVNALKIVGYGLVCISVIGLLNLLSEYLTGAQKFWPFGAEIGAGLMIWLGIFLIKRGNKRQHEKL